MTAPTEITEPGVYDIPHDAYHAHDSLSSSGARKLLPPSCPARYRWDRDHGEPHKTVFDIGHAAHMLVLGEGPDLVAIDGDYKTKANRDARDAAYASGKVPLKPDDYRMVHDMAAALRRHDLAAQLLAPGTGRAEISLFWTDDETGVVRRARPDWLGDPVNGLTVVADYKTAISAEPEAIRKAVASHGYHSQAPWYLDGIRALGLADDAAFLFIFQEKTAPYLVTVAQLDQVAMDIGAARNRQAIRIYADCVETGRWPGYSDDVVLTSLPTWAEARALQEIP